MTLEDKDFYRKLLLIGIPVVLQNLISIGLNLIDTIMIGMLGEEQLAAVGAANQIYFIFSVSIFGLFSGAAVFTSQYYGAGNIDGIRKVVGIDYLLATTIGITVSIIAIVLAPQLLSIFSDDEVVIGYGVDYIRIAAFSYTFAGLSFSVAYNSRAIQKLRIPTAINAIALCINAVLNYLLIFGIGVFPELGVKGAAYATLIARMLEFIAMMFSIYIQKEHPLKAGIKELFSFDQILFKRVCKTAVPVFFTEAAWSVSTALVFAIYGILGTSALAVVQIGNVMTEVLQTLYFGVGNAVAMIIGESLGKNAPERAYNYGGKALKITMVLNVVITIALILLSHPISAIYDFNQETLDLLVITLCTMAILITPKMIDYMYVVGILRAGGDSVYCMKVELFTNLVMQVGLAYLAVVILETSLPIAMIIVEISSLIRWVIAKRRYKSKKWINIIH